MQKPGTVVEEPVGDLCWLCGCTCEVWPLEEAKQVLERRSSDPAFRAQWTAVRAGVEKAVQRESRAQDVWSTKSLATRIICKAALVTEDAFAQFFKMPAGSVPGVRLVSYTGPENQTLSGVLLDLQSLPPGVPALHHRDVSRHAAHAAGHAPGPGRGPPPRPGRRPIPVPLLAVRRGARSRADEEGHREPAHGRGRARGGEPRAGRTGRGGGAPAFGDGRGPATTTPAARSSTESLAAASATTMQTCHLAPRAPNALAHGPMPDTASVAAVLAPCMPRRR